MFIRVDSITTFRFKHLERTGKEILLQKFQSMQSILEKEKIPHLKGVCDGIASPVPISDSIARALENLCVNYYYAIET